MRSITPIITFLTILLVVDLPSMGQSMLRFAPANEQLITEYPDEWSAFKSLKIQIAGHTFSYNNNTDQTFDPFYHDTIIYSYTFHGKTVSGSSTAFFDLRKEYEISFCPNEHIFSFLADGKAKRGKVRILNYSLDTLYAAIGHLEYVTVAPQSTSSYFPSYGFLQEGFDPMHLRVFKEKPVKTNPQTIFSRDFLFLNEEMLSVSIAEHGFLSFDGKGDSFGCLNFFSKPYFYSKDSVFPDNFPKNDYFFPCLRKVLRGLEEIDIKIQFLFHPGTDSLLVLQRTAEMLYSFTENCERWHNNSAHIHFKATDTLSVNEPDQVRIIPAVIQGELVLDGVYGNVNSSDYFAEPLIYTDNQVIEPSNFPKDDLFYRHFSWFPLGSELVLYCSFSNRLNTEIREKRIAWLVHKFKYLGLKEDQLSVEVKMYTGSDSEDQVSPVVCLKKESLPTQDDPGNISK